VRASLFDLRFRAVRDTVNRREMAAGCWPDDEDWRLRPKSSGSIVVRRARLCWRNARELHPRKSGCFHRIIRGESASDLVVLFEAQRKVL
jgi:hypothetical protein